MLPKRKRFGFFGLDDDFDSIFEGMEEMMRDMMERAEKGQAKPGRPLVYGYSIRMGPDGKVVVDEFGNTAKGRPGAPAAERGPSDEREPITDVIVEKENVVVISELPGVNKDDIKLTVTEKTVSIKVDTGDRKYNKTVRLNAVVDTKNVEANYKNGVLEVRLRKIKDEPASGKEVRIK